VIPLDLLKSIDEQYMPDTFTFLVPGTTAASGGQVKRTGETTGLTVNCRLRELTSDEVVTDTGGRIVADYELSMPVGTPVNEEQEGMHVSSDTGVQTRLRIASPVDRTSYYTSCSVLCKYIKEGGLE
jgi:hypothetical protein